MSRSFAECVSEVAQFQSSLILPLMVIDALKVWFSRGASGEGDSEPIGLPYHRTGTLNGLPACPGDNVGNDKFGYDGD